MTFGSLFTGAAGMDLGFLKAGMQCAWQCENSTAQRLLLRERFKEAVLYGDVRSIEPARVDLICGGDPCPKHSRARSNGDSNSPDLGGYFLALVGRLRPAWVVRENVPSPTVGWFDAALAALGYGTVIIRMDAAKVTGQSRQRDFIVGCYQAASEVVREIFSDCEDGAGAYETVLGTRPVAPCLTTHRTRYDSRDCYVWEPGGGLRILDSEEREAFAGFPQGWTAGFSPATRAVMCGNAVVPAVAQYIGERILTPSPAT